MEKPDICNVEKMKYEPLNNKDMKKLLGLITALYFGLASLNAMSYEEARDRARFLTDKMAYELNLNDQQYNDAYEINLDYLMNIRTASDASSVYLEYRNADLRFILYDWQYALFQAATYFFRPVIWRTSGWFLPVYTIYSPSRFYYSPPRVYQVYRGGHYHYRHEHRQSFYAHRRPVWNGGLRGESRGPLPGGRPYLLIVPGRTTATAAPVFISNHPADRHDQANVRTTTAAMVSVLNPSKNREIKERNRTTTTNGHLLHGRSRTTATGNIQ